MISPTFIKRFNTAAELARNGKHKEALEAFNKINNPLEDPKENRVITGEFLGTVELRKAYCLMDLKRYEEARNLFESDIMKATLGQFDTETLYFYFFSFANTLGNLGEIKEMDKNMSKALNIAAEELGDVKKCEDAWYWLLFWAKEHKEWKYLEEQAISAHKFGVNSKSSFLQNLAGEFGCYAEKGLGKIDKSKKGAEQIIARLKEAKADKKKIKVWEDFLKSLSK
ncbi:MAG: tetratricopeptide repeat protein [Spirochaetes bacterium]|nr:tetratricopeptide repeat protein [Spirochaetota bacterium]